MNWIHILELQDKFYPNWRKTKPKTLLSTALAGEIGEVCSVVTHLEGGGTNLKKYNRKQILHDCVDSYVQIVLLLASYDFKELDFWRELDAVISNELPKRLKARNKKTCGL